MNTLRRIPSDFLVAQPSWITGFGRLADFGCALDEFNYSASPQEADFRAMLADWLSVGFDILHAIERLDEERDAA